MAQHTNRERTCVACRKKSAKLDFFRFVRLPNGDVCFDKTGRANGRGAYVCSKECLNKALSTGQLGRALKTRINEQDAKRISDEFSETCATK